MDLRDASASKNTLSESVTPIELFWTAKNTKNSNYNDLNLPPAPLAFTGNNFCPLLGGTPLMDKNSHSGFFHDLP